MLRYILFHHQTTTSRLHSSIFCSCVISSFITKPQLHARAALRYLVALYPLSSPNHNANLQVLVSAVLRYILFHHQTTTHEWYCYPWSCCVISSFITKPQLVSAEEVNEAGCVISSFITKPQPELDQNVAKSVALYPLSSPNHNLVQRDISMIWLRYILFHHQTTTSSRHNPHSCRCVISSFITKPQLIV